MNTHSAEKTTQTNNTIEKSEVEVEMVTMKESPLCGRAQKKGRFWEETLVSGKGKTGSTKRQQYQEIPSKEDRTETKDKSRLDPYQCVRTGQATSQETKQLGGYSAQQTKSPR